MKQCNRKQRTMKIKLLKYCSELIPPHRSHYNDAGLDCYATDNHRLAKGKITDIPLGFGLEIPDGYMATLRPRSSMNLKGIITQIGTIDSGYRGEIKAMFINLGDEDYIINAGDKICQIVIEPVVLAELVFELNNDRGENGFGSTGR